MRKDYVWQDIKGFDFNDYINEFYKKLKME